MIKKNLAIAGVIIGALIASAFWGYSRGRSSTAEKYEAQISELKSDWQKQTRAVEKEAQERYEKQSKQLAEALAARDKAMVSARTVRTVAVRVRDAADTRAKSDLQAARDTGDRTQERLARCESLLGEGAELVGEGASLSVRVAADKETMRATCVAGDMANFVGGSEIIGN
jgi:uncharacterized protein YukE